MVKAAFKVQLLALVILGIPLFAQTEISPAAGVTGLQACGDPGSKFDVKNQKDHAPIQPVDGMAVVVVIEDDSDFKSVPKPTTRVGLDGQWIGATHGDSFASFLVSPGEHHLCASWQPQAALGLAGATYLRKMSRRSSVQSLEAQAGGVYYFQIKNVFFSTPTSDVIEIHLDPVDSGEGQLLASDRMISQAAKK